jgi:hypothetical protein
MCHGLIKDEKSFTFVFIFSLSTRALITRKFKFSLYNFVLKIEIKKYKKQILIDTNEAKLIKLDNI